MARHAVRTKETAENVVTCTPSSLPYSDHLPAVDLEPLCPALQNGGLVLCPLSGWPRGLGVSVSAGATVAAIQKVRIPPPFLQPVLRALSCTEGQGGCIPWRMEGPVLDRPSALDSRLLSRPRSIRSLLPQPTHWLPFTGPQALLLLGTPNLGTHVPTCPEIPP